jgi:aspartate-semialdehyde dehydrogenase
MPDRIPVAVLGATGSVGQRFIQLLDKHPMFEVVALTGSERRGGQTYQETCHWILTDPMPDWARNMTILPSNPEHTNARLAFSALPADVARDVEPIFAQAGVTVCSNASAYRAAADVPLLLPEVNPEHAALINIQRQSRGWTGALTTNPNCTSTGLTVALKAIQDAFGLKRVFAVSLQAVSGAGYPGVPSLDIIDNVIPYIGGSEEAKMEWEPRKMLGKLENNEVSLADFTISAHTNRVPVSDGHLVCISIELANHAPLEKMAEALKDYQAPPSSRNLPSTPRPVIELRLENDRPQPRLDRMSGGGMTTVVGRLRPDPLFHYKLIVLSHNTIRGAAGGSLYNAELLVDGGYIQ